MVKGSERRVSGLIGDGKFIFKVFSVLDEK